MQGGERNTWGQMHDGRTGRKPGLFARRPPRLISDCERASGYKSASERLTGGSLGSDGGTLISGRGRKTDDLINKRDPPPPPKKKNNHNPASVHLLSLSLRHDLTLTPVTSSLSSKKHVLFGLLKKINLPPLCLIYLFFLWASFSFFLSGCGALDAALSMLRSAPFEICASSGLAARSPDFLCLLPLRSALICIQSHAKVQHSPAFN